ncbi:unnamed protein product [Urochloa humidicola]
MATAAAVAPSALLLSNAPSPPDPLGELMYSTGQPRKPAASRSILVLPPSARRCLHDKGARAMLSQCQGIPIWLLRPCRRHYATRNHQDASRVHGAPHREKRLVQDDSPCAIRPKPWPWTHETRMEVAIFAADKEIY